MAPDVSECESGSKNVRFSRKMGMRSLKMNSSFGHFWKIEELNGDMFLKSPKAKLIACILKVDDGFMSTGAREKATHYGDL